MRLRIASCALRAWLVSLPLGRPHGAVAAPKRPTPGPPAPMPQHPPGPPGAPGQRPMAVPEPSTTRLLGLGLGGIVALEWRRRQHVAQP